MRVTGLLVLSALTLTLTAVAGGEKGKGKFDPAKLTGKWSYVSGEKDGKKIDPKDLAKGYVEIIKKTITLKASHASLASMPNEVAALIVEAAIATAGKAA